MSVEIRRPVLLDADTLRDRLREGRTAEQCERMGWEKAGDRTICNHTRMLFMLAFQMGIRMSVNKMSCSCGAVLPSGAETQTWEVSGDYAPGRQV